MHVMLFLDKIAYHRKHPTDRFCVSRCITHLLHNGGGTFGHLQRVEIAGRHKRQGLECARDGSGRFFVPYRRLTARQMLRSNMTRQVLLLAIPFTTLLAAKARPRKSGMVPGSVASASAVPPLLLDALASATPVMFGNRLLMCGRKRSLRWLGALHLQITEEVGGPSPPPQASPPFVDRKHGMSLMFYLPALYRESERMRRRKRC